MTNTSWQDKAPGGCQPGGQANAAGQKITVAFSPAAADYIEWMLRSARELQQPVSHVFEITMHPDGKAIINGLERDKPVWMEIEELIDP